MTEQVTVARVAPPGWTLAGLTISGGQWPGRIPRIADGHFTNGAWSVALTLVTDEDGSAEVVSMTVESFARVAAREQTKPGTAAAVQRLRTMIRRHVEAVAERQGLSVEEWVRRESPPRVAGPVPDRITGRQLRSLPLDALASHLLAQARMVATTGTRSADADAIAQLERELRTARRRRLTPEHLSRVAKAYTEALARGEHPTEAVRHEFGKSRATAERYVSAARASGHLTARSPHDPTHQKDSQ